MTADAIAPGGGSIAARAYGPDFDREGEQVTCSLSVFGLQIAGEHAHIAVPGWQGLRWRRGGFNDSQLFVEWSTDRGACTLAVSDPDAVKTLMARLQGGPDRPASEKRTRRISTGLIAVLVGIPIALVIAFVALTGPIIEWAVGRIPVEMEIKFGRQAFAQQRASLAIVDSHRALPMLKELGGKLTQGSPYPYEFYIARDPSVNAFAMPGGFVVFHTGLLEKADSAEEIAGVLAHEVQHVERRHGLRGLVHAAGWRIALSLLLGDAGGSVAAAWAENLGNLNFSRSQESEADALGVQRLLANDIDPHGMAAFFRKLMAEGPNVPTLLSSHPASEDRMHAIEAAIPPGRKFAPLPYDYPRLKAGP